MSEHQDFERDWWGNCANTFGEETKQITYASRMGLVGLSEDGHWPVYDLGGKSVLDIGGGPASMLLKAKNFARATVIDPCDYPEWIDCRYQAAGIEYIRQPAEYPEPMLFGYDEVWIYNVLQHVEDPEAVLRTARMAAPVIRLFEWIDLEPSIGHPNTLTASRLMQAIGRGKGTVERLDENGATGFAFYGVF